MKHTESTLEEVRDDKDLFGHPRPSVPWPWAISATQPPGAPSTP